MDRREFLRLSGVTLALSAVAGCSKAFRGNNGRGKPNVILINADDLGYGDLGCYGATKVKTPNIDSLAKDGRMFSDAHSASAVCSPSRYGLLTGRYPLRRNLWGPIGTSQPLAIDTKLLTLGSLMKDVGYDTACIGKWHLGFGEKKTDWNGDLKPGPLELGFGYYFGLPMVNSGPPFVYVENHRVVGLDPADPFVEGKESVTQKWPAKGGYKAIGGARKAHELYKDEEVGTTFKDKAIEWIAQRAGANSSKPYFLYLATSNIHHPFTPAPQFKGTSECGLYGDFIHELDWIVGEIISAVEKTGQADNTLVIFTSDNGGMLNHGGQDAWRAGHRLNGELLGFKFGVWEGGHRIPFIAKWPGVIPANSRGDQLFSHVDLMATFSAIVNRPLQKGEGIDSINQLETLTGAAKESLRKQLVLCPNSPSHLAIRKGKWVYIPAQNEGGFKAKKIGDHTLGGAAAFKLTGQVNSDVVDGEIRKDAPKGQLYDLKTDPYQTKNLYEEYPDVVKKLDSIINDYRKEIGPYERTGWIN